MFRRRLLICLALCCLAQLLTRPSSAIAQQKRPKLQVIVDEAVEKEMKRQNIVGVSVGIISKAKVAYTQGYGFADLKARVPLTNKSVINWASNSKPVMAVLAMQLVQNGKLDLDKTINNYLPKLPRHLHSVTPRHLLTHQSGIPHYSNGKIVPSKALVAPADEKDPAVAMNRFIQSPLIFKPGEKQEYSSYAFVLLSAVVQAAGKQPIADQISERITTPLRLDSFQMDVPFANQEDWSKAYIVTKRKSIEVKDQAHFWKHGAGAYKSNVNDFANFTLALMKSKLTDRRTTIQMMTPQPTNDGRMTTMGLGVYVSGSGKKLKVSHNGSQDETKTRMVMYPKQRHAVVVMCNCRHAEPGEITTAIYNALNKNKVKY